MSDEILFCMVPNEIPYGNWPKLIYALHLRGIVNKQKNTRKIFKTKVILALSVEEVIFC